MDVYCIDHSELDRNFEKLCNSVKLRDGITKQDLLDAGFTNYCNPSLYFTRKISESKSPLEITFNISIDAETLEIRNFSVLNEDFLQPCPLNKFNYDRIVEFFNGLIKKKVFEKVA